MSHTDEDRAAAKKRWEAAMQKLTRQLVDQGLLIESGWIACRTMTLPPDCPSGQIETCRTMFFAGAQHLWGAMMSAMGMMEEDREPTENDMRRMSMISAELDHFIEDFAKRHGIKQPFAEPKEEPRPS